MDKAKDKLTRYHGAVIYDVPAYQDNAGKKIVFAEDVIDFIENKGSMAGKVSVIAVYPYSGNDGDWYLKRVICFRDEASQPWVLWSFNTQDGGLFSGVYCETLYEAIGLTELTLAFPKPPSVWATGGTLGVKQAMDSLYNCTIDCLESRDRVPYAKGLFVGLVSGIMSYNECHIEEALKAVGIILKDRMATIVVDCVPESWRELAKRANIKMTDMEGEPI